jgi:D-alanyl-lipoteichoic acid acyltransferase DltB (MBOAT superfamily)
VDNASFEFIAFGLIAALLSNISRSPAWRSSILMLASLMFLFILARNPLTLAPLIGFLLLGYGCLKLLERGWKQGFAWCMVGVIVVYVWLKKYTFIPNSLFIQKPYLVLGLSYIFFRVMQVLIVARYAEDGPRISFPAYILYNLNFTTFLSGPIQRYEEFARDQFADQPVSLTPGEAWRQIERIVIGFFKINVLSVLLHTVQQDAVGQMHASFPLAIKMLAALKLIVVFPFYLYNNFSGYIDIVIALARLMRVRLPENFNRPFSATSFLDFWTRWHMSLSNWMKSNVYNPLLVELTRRVESDSVQPFLGVICFFVVFFLIGLWHGRTSEFLMLGFLLGGGVAVNKLWQMLLSRVMGGKGYRTLARRPWYAAFARGLTFSWYAFTCFWFWASWRELGALFSVMTGAEWLGVWLGVWLSTTIVLAAWEWAREALLAVRSSEGPIFTSRYARVAYATALGLGALAITAWISQPSPVIVYKAF